MGKRKQHKHALVHRSTSSSSIPVKVGVFGTLAVYSKHFGITIIMQTWNLTVSFARQTLTTFSKIGRKNVWKKNPKLGNQIGIEKEKRKSTAANGRTETISKRIRWENIFMFVCIDNINHLVRIEILFWFSFFYSISMIDYLMLFSKIFYVLITILDHSACL